MAEIKSRENNPVPGVDYSEICIPDDEKLGTGTFITVLEPNAMAKINPIISSIINVPVFRLMVSINLAIESVTALLGRDDNSPATTRKVFNLPGDIKLSNAHRFEIIFKDWEIEELKMNGVKLIEKQS